LRETALAAMKAKNWPVAIDAWQKFLLDADDRSGSAAFPHLLKSLRSVNRLSEADEALRKAPAEWKSQDAVRLEAAEIAYGLGQWKRAGEEFARVVPGNPRTKAGTWRRWASSVRHDGNLDAAAKILADARARFPGDRMLLDEATNLEVDLLHRNGQLFQQSDEALWSRGARHDQAPPGVEDVCECFWDIEEHYGLTDWEIGTVRCWTLMRMQLYYRITQLVGIFDAPHPALREMVGSAKNSSHEEMERYWAQITRKPKASRGALGRLMGLFSKTDEGPAKLDYAIIMATRQMNGQEPYTAALRGELGDRAILLDRPYMGNVGPGCVDLNTLQDFFRVRFDDNAGPRLELKDRMLCEKIRVAFSKRLNVDVGDLAALCQRQISRFHYSSRGFREFLGAVGIKSLFMTNGYSTTNQSAIAAARALGVHVVELQHGFISRFHLGYSWPRGQAAPYAPHEIWFFGDFWPASTPLAAGTKSRSIGAPYVKALALANQTPRDPKLVVFTSQGVIGKQLFDIALETARRRPDKRVLFRLHPSESLESYEESLAKSGDCPSNLELSHRTPNIFALLAQTSIQVGAFSTTLFEGMSLGSRTVVIDLPGVEYMRPAIENGDVLFVRNVDELVGRLDEAPLARSPQFYYAEPVGRLVA
jgi:hypothetical protein